MAIFQNNVSLVLEHCFPNCVILACPRYQMAPRGEHFAYDSGLSGVNIVVLSLRWFLIYNSSDDGPSQTKFLLKIPGLISRLCNIPISYAPVTDSRPVI